MPPPVYISESLTHAIAQLSLSLGVPEEKITAALARVFFLATDAALLAKTAREEWLPLYLASGANKQHEDAVAQVALAWLRKIGKLGPRAVEPPPQAVAPEFFERRMTCGGEYLSDPASLDLDCPGCWVKEGGLLRPDGARRNPCSTIPHPGPTEVA